ncbi:hypothetical protein GCM10028858_06650 [Halorubrum pallidum]
MSELPDAGSSLSAGSERHSGRVPGTRAERGATTLFGRGVEAPRMADDDASDAETGDEQGGDGEEKSFRERVEEIRERREEEREEGDRPSPEEMMGGGGGGPPGMGGGGGGNPFAQMMSGMMGGGGPGGAGGPPGMGGGPGGRGEEGSDQAGNEELVREVRQLRDEVRDATRQLQRIAQALEDD